MELSKSNKAIIVAYKKGYRALPDGSVKGITKIIKLSIWKEKNKKYHYFSIRDYDNIKVSLYVHRLVAYQKFGDIIFDPNIQVRHLDDNGLNNADYNISIGNQSKNMMDIPADIRMKKAIHASTKIRKFTDIEMLEIRKLRNKGWTYKELMEKFDISSKGTMSYIINNKYVTKK